ncbi:MAG TPA: TolC family protein, partial [Noviherbaspirillum sp.]
MLPNVNFNNHKTIFMLRRFNSIALPITLSLLAGCSSVGKDFVSPENIASESYRYGAPGASDTSDTTLPADWWTVFGDQTLNRLEARAFRDSPGLKVSAQRLVQAQALLGIAKAAQMPTFNANVSMQKLRSSLNTQQSIVFGRQLIYGNNFAVGASMAYEVDLWGRVRHMVEAADAQLQAAKYDHVGVALLLSTQVANLYWQLRGATIEQQILEKALETRKETRTLVEARFQAGLSNELDVARTHLEEA